MAIQKYSGCRKGCGRITGYPVRDGDDLYLVYRHEVTGWTFFAVDPDSLQPVIETNMDAITASPETLTAFVDRVYRWGQVGGCQACPVDDMFCEANLMQIENQDCEEVFRRWLQKTVRKDHV